MIRCSEKILFLIIIPFSCYSMDPKQRFCLYDEYQGKEKEKPITQNSSPKAKSFLEARQIVEKQFSQLSYHNGYTSTGNHYYIFVFIGKDGKEYAKSFDLVTNQIRDLKEY